MNNNVTQEQMDSLLARIRVLVDVHGGQSDKLATLRHYYTMLHDRVEHVAFTLTKQEVERLEKQAEQEK